jgi:hypothetical protein
MEPQAFSAFLADHDAVRAALQRSSQALPARGFGLATDAATLVLLFPLVRFVVVEIGLPWLVTLKRYSELQRRRVEDWIDGQTRAQGLDPDQLEAASRQLMQELERTTDTEAHAQWQQLQDLLKQ